MELIAYLEPMWRWIDVLQNDFAARADWRVKPFAEANHPPVVVLVHTRDLVGRPGATIELSASGSSDADGHPLSYRWWQYRDAGSYPGIVELREAQRQATSFTVPSDAAEGQTIHLICEATDGGTPCLTRYQRVIVSIAPSPVVRLGGGRKP
jgi:hypothetical protein